MMALFALAFATLAALSAGQASMHCSTGVTSVTGGGPAWSGAQTLRNDLPSNAGRDYVFKGVPSFLDGGEYFASGIWPGNNGATYTLTIQYTAPAMVFVYVSGDGSHDAGMSARLVADGWDSEAVDTFYRHNPRNGHEKVLHVYSKFFDSGSQTVIGPLQGTLVSGVISTCDHPTSTRTSSTSTSTTITGTTTSSTRTTTTTSSTTLSTTTRTWTGTTTTLTTITSTTTSTTTATTTSTTVTTTTITTTTTTTTTVHRVALIEGQMYMTVDRPTELNDQINNNDAVYEACIHGLANSLPGVEPHLARIVRSELGNQMPSAANGQNGNGQNGNGQNGNNGNNGGNRRLRGAAPRRLTGVVAVTYQAVVPLELVVLNDLTAQYFLSNTTRDNLNLHVAEQIQAVTDYVISEVEVTEPTFTVTWSYDLEHFFETEDSPPGLMETDSSDDTAAGGWIVILMLSVVGVCCTSFVGWNCIRRKFTLKPEKEVSEDEIYEGNNRGLSARSFGDLSTAGSQMGPEMSDGCSAPPPRRMVTFGAGEKVSDDGSCEGPVFALCDAAQAEQDTLTIDIPGPGKDIAYIEQDLDKLQRSHLGSEESQEGFQV